MASDSNAKPGAIRVRRHPDTTNSVLGADDILFEILQNDGTWLPCPFLTALEVKIVPDELPVATVSVLLNDVGLDFADPEQLQIVQDLRGRVALDVVEPAAATTNADVVAAVNALARTINDLMVLMRITEASHG